MATHYITTTVLGDKAEVFIEYDYSDPKSVDVHIYHIVFMDRGTEINEPKKMELTRRRPIDKLSTG